jgi:hypothetical protein
MIILENAQYVMELGCGSDVWRLYGNAYGHPKFPDGRGVFVSLPQSFDEITDEMTTISGSHYKINSYIDREKVIEQIKKDIISNGYEVH